MNKMPGQVFCLLGPNGSGKSTLLKCIMQLLTPAAGRVVTVGKEVNRKICIPVLRENTGPSLAKEVS
jgi:ABC-type cobalamin/Fe3+-siderophores transport system ATPase subunit